MVSQQHNCFLLLLDLQGTSWKFIVFVITQFQFLGMASLLCGFPCWLGGGVRLTLDGRMMTEMFSWGGGVVVVLLCCCLLVFFLPLLPRSASVLSLLITAGGRRRSNLPGV